MKVVYAAPGKTAVIKETKGDLKSLQTEVDGYIEAFYPFEEPVAIICNDEGKFNGMSPNRAVYDKNGDVADIIFGPFLIVGLTEDDFGDCPNADYWREKFIDPEAFVRANGKIIAIKYKEAD